MGLFDIFNSSSGKQAASDAAAARNTGYNNAFSQASDYYNTGLTGATEQYNKASDLFNQWYDTGSSANQMYANALGLNGAEGTAAAQSAFTESPSYQYSLDQGLNAILRSQSAKGMLGTGNTTTDELVYATNLANQEWQSYLNNLNTASASGQSAASSQASQLDQLASTISNTNTNLGNLAYSTQTGIGNSNAQMVTDQYAAEQAANQNLWNGLFQVGGLAASLAGGGLPSFGGDAGLGSWGATVTRA